MTLAREQLLRELAAMAEGVDVLDARAKEGDEPYADEALDAQLVAKRSRLLLELEVAGVLSAEGAARARLVALDVPRLLGYHDAGRELARYLVWPTRARLVRTPPPERINDARVSLEWFMVPSGYTPPGVYPLDWLALCEANFVANGRPRAGRVFVKLEGAYHQLWFRTEVGLQPKLYRATPA